MRAVVLVAALLVCCEPVRAEQPSGIDVSVLGVFVEDFFPREMARRHIPGTVFVFVSGGEIAIARGFGVAELEPPRPVDPGRTVFRLASVSKMITATAALQLVERKRLDLNVDVNRFLKTFQLAATHGPITLHHLLTHTAGFDERLTGAGARSAADVQPSSSYLARSMPPTFIEPGRVISYSNHGFALIGHLVEDTSGRPFADYVREHVFEPLGMQRSGSLSARIPDNFAVAYDYADGQHRALAADYLQVGSAGAFYTTGIDMGRFLIAHLRGGAYRDARILRPETVDLMHTRQFAQAPGTSGWAYGIWEDMRNGQRALLHNGGGKGFRALMYLLPQQDAGFFIAYNLADRHAEGELQEVFITQFRKQFLPAPQQRASPISEHASTESLAGDYLYVRRARTTVEKMIAIPNAVRVTSDGNGGVTISGLSGTTALTPIAPSVFQRADGRGVVAFDAVVDNTPHRLVAITDSGFPAVYERIPWFATMRTQGTWLFVMALAFLYAAAWRPAAALAQRSPLERSRSGRWMAWLAGIASALNLVFIVGFPLAFLGPIEGGVPEFLYGTPATAGALLLITPITALMAIAAAITVAAGWLDRRQRMTARLRDAAVAAALLSFSLFAWYWRLLPVWL